MGEWEGLDSLFFGSVWVKLDVLQVVAGEDPEHVYGHAPVQVSLWADQRRFQVLKIDTPEVNLKISMEKLRAAGVNVHSESDVQRTLVVRHRVFLGEPGEGKAENHLREWHFTASSLFRSHLAMEWQARWGSLSLPIRAEEIISATIKKDMDASTKTLRENMKKLAHAGELGSGWGDVAWSEILRNTPPAPVIPAVKPVHWNGQEEVLLPAPGWAKPVWKNRHGN